MGISTFNTGDYEMSWGDYVPANIAAGRIMQDKSAEFRWLEYTNGKKVLQVACRWNQGNTSGIEWRNIPVVKESVE